MESVKSRENFLDYIDLQLRIFSLNESNFENLNELLESTMFQANSNLHVLSHNLLHIIDYRPQSIVLLINYIISLVKISSDIQLAKLILEEITENKPSNSRLYFLYQATNYDLIPKEVILSSINEESIEYFVWFAPIIEELDPELFEKFMDEKIDRSLISFIEQLRENNWKLHNQFASEGMNHDQIAVLIRDDNVKNLTEIENFDFNQPLPSSPFESIEILNYGCTPIHYSIYFKSQKCYNFLIEKGSNLYRTDYNGLNSIHFAIAGENYSFLEEIIKSSSNEEQELFQQNILEALRYSVKYHLNQYFDELMNKYSEFVDISMIFLTAATSDNAAIILKCIDNNVDVNCCNYNDENVLIIAAENNHFQLVEFLLSVDSINPSHVDKLGRNVLICAANKNNYEIVKTLLNDSRIDINAFDAFK